MDYLRCERRNGREEFYACLVFSNREASAVCINAHQSIFLPHAPALTELSPPGASPPNAAAAPSWFLFQAPELCQPSSFVSPLRNELAGRGAARNVPDS